MSQNDKSKTVSSSVNKKQVAGSAVVNIAGLAGQTIWTALPNGTEGTKQQGKLKLSVFVSPRLKQEDEGSKDTLNKYPDFIDWPAKVRSLQFSVEFQGGPTVDATRVSVDPDSELWKALFKPSAPVKGFFPAKLLARPVLSYPVAHVQTFIKRQYLSVAAEPTLAASLPPVEHFAHEDRFGQIAFNPQPVQVAAAELTGLLPMNNSAQISQEMKQALKSQKVIPARTSPEPSKDFTQFKMFHEAVSVSRTPFQPPELDFHEALSSVGRYPELMRKLGLVIDLEIPWTTAVPAGGAASTVRVIPKWGSTPHSSGDYTPRTKYILSGKSFQAAPRSGSDIQNGMLRLSAPEYEVVQLDVDSAASKTMEFANTAVIMVASQKKSQGAGLPSLRTAGLSVVRSGRDKKMRQAMQVAQANNAVLLSAAGKPAGQAGSASDDVILYADDVVRGYRVDVWESKSKAWRSLCSRLGNYHFVDGNINLQIEDEGFVSSAVTRSPDGSQDTPLNLHESLFRWTGWSLCAPRPGKTIRTDDTCGDVSNDPVSQFKLKTTFTVVPGTLPKLRFGSTYRLRARCVDLAGNSLKLDEIDPTDFSCATEPVVYTRFEPVPSPAVIQRKDLTGVPGESVERLVIRSYNNSPAKDNAPCQENSERHIAPPRTAQQMAETHGMFDQDKGLDKSAYDVITSLDSPTKDVEPDAPFRLPYLPDPLAVGSSLYGCPGKTGEPVKVEFYASESWPGAKPFLVRLVEGTGEPKWDGGSRILTVFLPKAEMKTVSLSSYLSEKDLPPMGLWNWLEHSSDEKPLPILKPAVKSKKIIPKLNLAGKKDVKLNTSVPAASASSTSLPAAVKMTTAKLANIRKIAIAGRHWMFTPSRDVVLVHAVQQPLANPALEAQSDRSRGQTFTRLTGKISVHGKSTGKVDVAAEWEEPVDDLTETKWRTISGKSQVFEQGVKPEDTSVIYRSRQHNFGDTKYRRVRYTPTATTRFREYFSFSSKEQAHSMSFTRSGEMVELDILSSARPAAPKVLYIVPAFGWETQKDDSTGKTRKRSGGWLRVYMDRPWYSSGDGELLGVVIATPKQGIQFAGPKQLAEMERMKSYVTQWGADPIWASGQTYKNPLLEHFKSKKTSATDLTLDELTDASGKGPKVQVAGHGVHYDEDRQLWYSDIRIDAGPSYYPFIRLALARYQPKSIPNVHLSRVVLADFAQLAPDRVASVSYLSSTKLKVSVTGACYGKSYVGPGPTEVEVSVEACQGDPKDLLAWIPVPEATFRLTPSKAGGNVAMWGGDVTLPEARGSKKFRLVIKEYERFAVDGDGKVKLAIMSVPDTDRRLVYADVLEI